VQQQYKSLSEAITSLSPLLTSNSIHLTCIQQSAYSKAADVANLLLLNKRG